MRFAVRNIGRFLLLMLLVSLVTFTLVSVAPIDPLQVNVGQAALMQMSDEKRAQLAAFWGADRPMHERYVEWLGAALQGDLGMSLRYNRPVVQVLAERAANTLALMAVAWVLSGVIGFALGVLAGVRKGSWIDRLVRGYCFVLAASPTFWIGLVFLVVFAVNLGWFPIGFSSPIGALSTEVSFVDALHHMALPALTLSLVGVANIALHTREKTVEVMESPYVRYALARGEGMGSIVRRHVLRNVSLPFTTLQFAQIAEIFGGSVLVEEVFSYPGLGQAAVTAGLGGDMALLAGIALFSAALVFGGNLVANLIYGVIDPRMRKEVLHG